jgi:hypothetical protein
MVWEMSSVFERAIAKLAKISEEKIRGVVFAQGSYASEEGHAAHSVRNQHVAHYEDDPSSGHGLLKLDILIIREGRTAVVIDTKWKYLSKA